MQKLRYFKWTEFDSRDIPNSGEANMQISTVGMLDEARHIAGVPFTPTSAYRSPARNAAVGGVTGSSHPKGWAVDLEAVEHERKRIILVNRCKVMVTSMLRDGKPNEEIVTRLVDACLAEVL